MPLVDLAGAVSRGLLGQRGGAAVVMGRGLQPDQPSGRKGEVPGAACVPKVCLGIHNCFETYTSRICALDKLQDDPRFAGMESG